MDVFGRLLAMLARAIGRDVGHRAGTIERDERDDVLEAVGAHVDQRAAHALTFHLEHADRFAARQHFVGRRVVERQASDVEIDAAPAHELGGTIEHRQRLQAEEVELHQPRLLDPFHVELGDLHVGFRIAVERHEFAQRPVADDDAGGVRRGVAIQSFKTAVRYRRRGPPPDLRRVAACSFGSLSMAALSVTGAAGFCGTSLQSLSTCP